MPYGQVLSLLGVDTQGLSEKEVLLRKGVFGENILKEETHSTVFAGILKQVKNPLVLILLGAGILTLVLREFFDSIVIFIALSVNVLIGMVQEGRASRAFEKLSSSQERFAEVIREGKRRRVKASDLVVGDIVVLEQGGRVPADLRLIETNSLEVDEAVLTGESSSVSKESDLELDEDEFLADRRNMTFMGTVVSGGFGKGVVARIGKDTELGKIAESLTSEGSVKTPIQNNMDKLARFLLVLVVLIIALIFALGIFRGESLVSLVLLSVAVAVSVVPEGLPAAVTAVLAVGMERILKKGGLVRNLLAAETLGATTVILTDKTGTLTKSEMKLEEIFSLNASFDLGTDSNPDDDTRKILYLGTLASDAFIEESEKGDVVRGRPLEKALLEAGLSVGIDQRNVLEGNKRVDYLPFSSERRFEVSLNEKSSGERMLVYSGSPEKMISMSGRVLVQGKAVELTEDGREYFNDILGGKTEDGMRFIAVAYDESASEIGKKEGAKEERNPDIVFAGIFAFSDPVREDVPEAVKTAQEAGARVIMLTGDHPGTALFVAKKAGIRGAKEGVLTGVQVSKLSDDSLRKTLKEKSVFARMTPQDKLRIAGILRNEGEVISMTGDGVNDAPALRFADIGVAVESGTEVAKEASDLILLGNSFSIIISAIEEGRRIIDNLKKVVTHLLSTGFGEVFVIVGAMIFGLPLPILPVQILWVNILNEGFLNFAFAFEPAESDVMQRDPGSARMKNILTSDVKTLIFISGIATGVLSLSLFLILISFSVPIDEIRTIIFGALSIDAIFFALSIKNLHRPVWEIKLFSNAYLLLALSASVVLLIASLSFGPLQTILSLAPLSSRGLLFLFVIGVLDVVIIETTKFFVFRGRSDKLGS